MELQNVELQNVELEKTGEGEGVGQAAWRIEEVPGVTGMTWVEYSQCSPHVFQY